MFLESQSHLIQYINDFFYDFSNDFRTLQKAEIPIADDEECIKLNSAYSGDKQICAGGQKGNQKSFKIKKNSQYQKFQFYIHHVFERRKKPAPIWTLFLLNQELSSSLFSLRLLLRT